MRTSPNRMDKILDKTVLWLIPKFVTPNHITIARLISIPFVVYFFLVRDYSIALPLFAISAFTDALDGAVARTRQQITDWGKLFDPIADKLLIASSAVVLISNEISFMLALSIITVDLSIFFVVAYQYNAHKKILDPHWTGKLKMLLQSFGIGFYLLYMLIPIVFISWIAISSLYLALLFALISLFIYRSS